MPFHVFLVQSLSLITGGLSVWKAAKDVFALVITVVTIGLVYWQKKSTKLFNQFLLLAIAYGAIHLLVWAINPNIYKQTAFLGTIYNTRLFGYLLIGMGAALLWPKELKQEKVIKVVLIISTIVCVLGVLQYFLSKDILTHLGYSIERGVKPNFFIDDKPDLPRIMSTLRDPNSLGAYLLIPLTILTLQLFDKQHKKRRMLLAGLLSLHLLALFLTFSRGAWLGAIIAAGLLGFLNFRKQVTKWLLKYWPLAVGGVLLIGSFVLMVKNQYVVQNVLEHSDKSTAQKSKLDSNGYHFYFVRRALSGIVHRPVGHGPGTAGIVSIQNPNGGFLTENYYLQIGYEVGVLGLCLFLFTLYLLQLHLRRKLTAGPLLETALFITFWSYTIMSLVAHLWTNEAVAVQWWLLAGFATTAIGNSHNKKRIKRLV